MRRSSPYDDLEPSMWRTLLAGAAVFHATRGVLGRLCDAAERDDTVKVLLLNLGRAARRFSRHKQDDQAAVAAVVAAWAKELHAALDDPELAYDTRHLLAETLRRLDQAACRDPFLPMLRAVEVHARALYGEHWRATSLSLMHRRSHPRGADPAQDPYAVTAMTPWPPGPTRARVELHIFSDRFGPAAYAALPTLLTHECVCHVPARQDQACNDSEFAEGYLDWVAYEYLRLWAMKLDPELGPMVRKHAERLRDVLCGDVTTKAGMARQCGHDAARELEGWFETEYDMTPDESRRRVLRLAVELNVVDRPLKLKNNFVSQLRKPFPPYLDKALRGWREQTVTGEELLDRVVEALP
ncbi:MAG TPA: hypothetical protein VFM55_03075 [Micromonosporaceae bacterium]|nr:hypothetical protein [Micromonosporaceae bacterium]